MLSNQEVQAMQEVAYRVRQRVIRMAGRGGCFLGAALSCTDLLVFLYTHFLRVNSAQPDEPQRDYLLLSKGHAVPAYYGVLAELGWLAPQRLERHLTPADQIYWHPNRQIPGVEFHSGSLGHGLPVAAGIALECKLRGTNNRVVVITGDGELNEGSNWEALLIAQAYRLDNLVVVVDRNRFQANLRTEDLIPLEPLAQKFEAFGAQVVTLDGHDFDALARAFGRLPVVTGQTSVIIAETVRGRGLPNCEARAHHWFRRLTPDEVGQLLGELANTHRDSIAAATLAVRG